MSVIVRRKYAVTKAVKSDMFPDRVYLKEGAIIQALAEKWNKRSDD